MAGILRKLGHEITFADFNAYPTKDSWSDVEKVIRRTAPEAVLFRSTPSTFFHDCRVAALAKKAQARTVMLNWNLSAFAGEAVKLVPTLDVYLTAYSYENQLEALFSGPDLAPHKVRGIVYREDEEILSTSEGLVERVGDIPRPPWELVPDHSVFYTRARAISPWGVVRGSKGCGFRCTMCVDAHLPWDARSPTLIVDEVEGLVERHKVKYVSFFDNTFTLRKRWVEDVCSELLSRQTECKWYINTRPDLLDEELIQTMKAAGLDGVSLGSEAGTDEVLQVIQKGFTVREGLEGIRLLKEADVKVYLSLMMGMPGETKKQMRATRDLVLRVKPQGFQISIVAPYPHTQLYRDAVEKGLLKEELKWDVISCVPTGLPDTVSLSELTGKELVDLRRRFCWYLYLHPSYLLPNLRWTLRHPSDWKVALSYVRTLLRRLYHGVTYAH